MNSFRSFRYILLFPVLTACTQTQTNRQSEPSPGKPATIQMETRHKPPSSYEDTLIISGASAVFYQPDSFQLEKIREVTEKSIFEGSQHEYENLIRYAHNELKAARPDLPVVEAGKVRYLLFTGSGNETFIIDLDKMDDSHGLILFDGEKAPRLVDMANLGTELEDYFHA